MGWILASMIGRRFSRSAPTSRKPGLYNSMMINDPVVALRIEVAHHLLDLLTALRRMGEPDIGDIGKTGSNLPGKPLLLRRDLRLLLVVKAVHDPKNPDFRFPFRIQHMRPLVRLRTRML